MMEMGQTRHLIATRLSPFLIEAIPFLNKKLKNGRMGALKAPLFSSEQFIDRSVVFVEYLYFAVRSKRPSNDLLNGAVRNENAYII